jgi:hypothetical protein
LHILSIYHVKSDHHRILLIALNALVLQHLALLRNSVCVEAVRQHEIRQDGLLVHAKSGEDQSSRKSGAVGTDVKQIARKAKEAAEAKAKAELAAKRQADVAAAEQAVAAAEQAATAEVKEG